MVHTAKAYEITNSTAEVTRVGILITQSVRMK